jgi:hypothetical protein
MRLCGIHHNLPQELELLIIRPASVIIFYSSPVFANIVHPQHYCTSMFLIAFSLRESERESAGPSAVVRFV